MYQLRRYRIAEGAMNDFVDAWRSGVVPLRQRFGFEMLGAWIIDDTHEFVWILGHADDFAAADAEYYRSPERTGLQPDPARYVESTEEVLMRRIWPPAEGEWESPGGFDEILVRLSEVNRLLQELPDEAFDERVALRTERDALRAAAARLRRRIGARATDEELLAELAHLKERKEDVLHERIDVVQQAGGGSTAGDFGFTADAIRINQAIEESLKEIETKIREIEQQLDGR